MKRRAVENLAFVLIFISFLIFLGFRVSKNRSTVTIDTTEVDRYYDLLKNLSKPATALTLSLGVGEKDKLEIALDRLKTAMGLAEYDIRLVYGNQEKPPAFVTNINQQRMIITVSKKVTERREQLNLLVHELGHVAVWTLDKGIPIGTEAQEGSGKSILGGCNPEKVVDCMGFFRGQGILTLNGLTEKTTVVPGEGSSTEKKSFGYLQPEEYGYLLARYCAEHGIPASSIAPFLEPAARKYFNIARNLDKPTLKSAQSQGPATGIYWCPKCGQESTVELSRGSQDIQCLQCGAYLKTQTWLDKTAGLLYDRLKQYQTQRQASS